MRLYYIFCRVYRSMKTTKFLSQGLDVEDEHIHLEDNPEAAVETIKAYSCSITGCDKTVPVSNSQGKVAFIYPGVLLVIHLLKVTVHHFRKLEGPEVAPSCHHWY